MNIISKLKLNSQEKKTFSLHLSYATIEGIIAGVLALNEFVFIKSLKGSDYQLSFLFSFSMVVFLMLIFINEFLKRIKSQRKLLRIVAVLTRLPLLLLLFFPDNVDAIIKTPIYHYIFLAIFLVYFLAHPIVRPLVNLFLKNSYRHENFGKLYSYSTTVNKIVILIITFLFGLILDYDNYAFTYIYPVIGILGIISIFLLSKIDYIDNQIDVSEKGFLISIKNSIKKMLDILKNDKPYFYFEMAFVLYGFAFMISYAVINIFFEDVLHLNYSSVAFYKNSSNMVAIFLLPYFGKLIGKIDPRKFGIITFIALLFYLLFMAITEYTPETINVFGISIFITLIISFVFLGIFTAGMHLLWSIGSAYFCKDEDAGIYQSVHLSLTGTRALFIPVLGIVMYELIGFSGTFLLGVIALMAGILILRWTMKKHKIKVKK